MNKKGVEYIYSEEFITKDNDDVEEELVRIFNYKFFKTIMKFEKNNFL